MSLLHNINAKCSSVCNGMNVCICMSVRISSSLKNVLHQNKFKSMIKKIYIMYRNCGMAEIYTQRQNLPYNKFE